MSSSNLKLRGYSQKKRRFLASSVYRLKSLSSKLLTCTGMTKLRFKLQGLAILQRCAHVLAARGVVE